MTAVDRSLSGLAARALRSRRLMRAPIGLYRSGLGALMGERIMMLEYAGRIRRAPATARFLSDAESAATLARYIERRPRDWDVLKAAMEKALGHPVEQLPMVELTLD